MNFGFIKLEIQNDICVKLFFVWKRRVRVDLGMNDDVVLAFNVDPLSFFHFNELVDFGDGLPEFNLCDSFTVVDATFLL